MNRALYLILKLLSRPVVCANFQGLEANTCFPASGVCQGHSRSTAQIAAHAMYTKFSTLITPRIKVH